MAAMVCRTIALVVAMSALAGCENRRQRELRRDPQTVQPERGRAPASPTSKAEQQAEAIRQGAEDLARRELDRADRQATAAAEAIVGGLAQVEREAEAALAAGRRVKAELDKVYKTDTDYELAVSRIDADDQAASAHAARLQAMPTVTIGAVTVGYVDESERSLRGVRYARHFRASWRRSDDLVWVSYFSREELDAAAFAALLQKLVPLVERELTGG